MSPLDAFDDERLNADLAAILCLRDDEGTPSIGRPVRRRIALANALRSPHASATIGISFFIAMLGTTAFLIYHPLDGHSGAAVPRPSVPRLNASNEASKPLPVAVRNEEDKPTVALAAEPADGARRERGPLRPALASRRSAASKPDDATMPVAATGGEVSTPVAVASSPTPGDSGVIGLAQNAAPLPLQDVEISADDRSVAPRAPDDAGAEDRSARVRRNSVAAIRALRRQW